jgi:hypothetical protein
MIHGGLVDGAALLLVGLAVLLGPCQGTGPVAGLPSVSWTDVVDYPIRS